MNRKNCRHHFKTSAQGILACLLAAHAIAAWSAGSSARPDGAAQEGGGQFFTTNGQLDALVARIDGGLWYSDGGPFVNIGLGIPGTRVTGNTAVSRDFIWAGTESGLAVTFDRGVTWQSRNTGLSCTSVQQIRVNRVGTTYVRTSCNGVSSVFRSLDRGLTWQALPATPATLNRLANTTDFQSQAQAKLYALTSNGRYSITDTANAWVAEQGLDNPFRNVTGNVTDALQTARSVCMMVPGPYRSDNCPAGGTTQPPATLQVQGLPAITASNLGLISYVNDDLLFSVVSDGVYKFNGTSWTRAYSNAQVPGIRFVRDLVPGSPIMFAASTTSGIWRSADSGATWQPFGLPGSSGGSSPALTQVTLPPQTAFTVSNGQLPVAAIASVAVSPDPSALTLVVTLDLSKILTGPPAQAFAASGGNNVYVVALVPGERLGAAAGQKFLFQLDAESNFGALSNPIAAFAEGVATGTADQRVRIEILNRIDARAFKGTEFFVGYGTSDAEMLQAKRYLGVYVIP